MSKAALQGEAKFGAAVERFVRETVGMTGDFAISRFRISGGSSERPVIDLRIVPNTPETAFEVFKDTGSARVDSLIYLLREWLVDNGGSFEGSATVLFKKMTSRKSVLSASERKAVPQPNWMGKMLSQVHAVGSRVIQTEFSRCGSSNVWKIRLKAKRNQKGG